VVNAYSVDTGFPMMMLDADDALRCPHCGNNYLDHGEVIVFSRREDAPITIETRIATTGLTCITPVPSREARNPSGRRNGLAIRFECENCDAEDLEFTLAQHKGQTPLAWRGKS
jgi:hypothetical protein